MSDMSELECPLRAAAIEMPEIPALEAPRWRMTFRELDERVEGTASLLRAHILETRERAVPGRGAPPSDKAQDGQRPDVESVAAEIPPRVALWMENDWRTVVLLLAAPRAGVVVCPLSTRLPHVDDALEHVDARTLISDREGTSPDRLMKRSAAGGLARHPAEQPATGVFTSGSSGRPKAALLSLGNHYYSALGSNANIKVAPGDRWLVSLPLYHVGGIAILYRCLLGRATIVLQGARDLASAAADATHLSLVATQLLRLLRADVELSHLKSILLGGSAMPPSLIEEAVRKDLPIHTSYGMTEMASQVATTPPGARPAELASSGRVLAHRELRIAPDRQIHVRGRTRFLGYLERRELTRPFDEDGWFATGDAGSLEEGLLTVHGRMDNTFISGGENVVPEEIERILTSRADIRQAIVVPVADAEFGRRPVAFVDTGTTSLEAEELKGWLAERLPGFKIPIRFFMWPKRDGASAIKVDRAAFEREADKLMRQ